MSRQEPVSREGAGHVERSGCAVWQRPGQSQSEGPWDDRIPREAGVQRIDYWRSPWPEVPIMQKKKKKKNTRPFNQNVQKLAQHESRW